MKQNSDLSKNLPKFHPVLWMPSHTNAQSLMCQTWHIAALSWRITMLHSGHKNCSKCIGSAIKIFYLHFLSQLDNFVGLFIRNFSNFLEIFAPPYLILTFFTCMATDNLFRLVSPATFAQIPLCIENSVALMRQVWCKPFYAGCPQKLCHYARHTWNNVYLVLVKYFHATPQHSRVPYFKG